jgi:hypothetical protein
MPRVPVEDGDTMRLPGTRYQEHGWEQVRKLLGRCSLAVFATMDMTALLDEARRADALDAYLDAMAAALHAPSHHAHAALAGNSYGDTAGELAAALLFELRAQPACWDGLCAAVTAEYARHGAFWRDGAGSALLRKKANDMYAVLRDRADADACQAATGKPCTPNRMYTYRMLDTAYGEIARIFANWRHCGRQVADILGREPGGMPIEARQMQSIADCRAEWVIRWSATLERYTGAPGPLHTRSKRFASLKNQPGAIAAMLEEIGAYEALSANMDALGQVRSDEEEAALWLEDYWRVVAQSEAQEAAGGADEGEVSEAPEPDLLDSLLAPHALLSGEDDDDLGDGGGAEDARHIVGDDGPGTDGMAPEPGISISLRSTVEAVQGAAGQVAQLLSGVSGPVRLAVYHALLGPRDDSYPDDWLDPDTGELPSLRQLAELDGISLPTLRKRRNEAVALLQQAAASGATGRMRYE